MDKRKTKESAIIHWVPYLSFTISETLIKLGPRYR